VEEFVLLCDARAPQSFSYALKIVRGSGKIRKNFGVVEVLDDTGEAGPIIGTLASTELYDPVVGTWSYTLKDTPDKESSVPCYHNGTKACNGKGQCHLASGQKCGKPDECASDYCQDGYCCKTACDGTCDRCNLDKHQGTCRPIAVDTDPDGECIGKNPDCGGTCDGNYQCKYPDVGKGCGTCKACDGKGDCFAAPQDDAQCGVIDCDQLDTACRDYQDLKVDRCSAFGVCKKANHPASCTLFKDLCAADAGSTPKPPDPQPEGCNCRLGRTPTRAPLVSLLAGMLALLLRCRRRNK